MTGTPAPSREFKGLWIDLMESVEAAVESGESRAEVMAWARAEHAEHADRMNSMAASEAGCFDEPVFDVQGRL